MDCFAFAIWLVAASVSVAGTATIIAQRRTSATLRPWSVSLLLAAIAAAPGVLFQIEVALRVAARARGGAWPDTHHATFPLIADWFFVGPACLIVAYARRPAELKTSRYAVLWIAYALTWLASTSFWLFTPSVAWG